MNIDENKKMMKIFFEIHHRDNAAGDRYLPEIFELLRVCVLCDAVEF